MGPALGLTPRHIGFEQHSVHASQDAGRPLEEAVDAALAVDQQRVDAQAMRLLELVQLVERKFGGYVAGEPDNKRRGKQELG